MQPAEALAPDPRVIGFTRVKPGSVFMDDQAKRIEEKVDRVQNTVEGLAEAVNMMAGARPYQEQAVRQLQDKVESLQKNFARQEGMVSLIKWAVPLISTGLSGGGAYLATILGGS